MTPQTRTLTLRERGRKRGGEESEAKLETTHWLSFSPPWRKRLTRKSPNNPLLSTLITSDWSHVCKSNNPITIKHRTFFYLLIPYWHVYTNPVVLNFFTYLFSIQLLKFYVPSYSLFLQLCFSSFLATIRWYNSFYIFFVILQQTFPLQDILDKYLYFNQLVYQFIEMRIHSF